MDPDGRSMPASPASRMWGRWDPEGSPSCSPAPSPTHRRTVTVGRVCTDGAKSSADMESPRRDPSCGSLVANRVRRSLTSARLGSELGDAHPAALEEALARWARPSWRGVMRCLRSSAVRGAGALLAAATMAALVPHADAPPRSRQRDALRAAEFAATGIFFGEALLYTAALPKVWTHKRILLECLTTSATFLVETVCLVLDKNFPLEMIFLARMLRLYPALQVVQDLPGARPLRVLLGLVGAAALNFVWVGLALAATFLGCSLLARSMLRAYDGDPTEVGAMVAQRFPSVPVSMLTLLEVFLGTFDYSEEITHPLLSKYEMWPFTVAWLIYLVCIKVYAVSIVLGLFVETAVHAGHSADERRQERQWTRHLNFQDLEGAFHKIDASSCGYITAADLERAVHAYPEIATLLDIKGTDTETGVSEYFRELDTLGSERLSFTDFVHGVVKHKLGPRTIDELMFDHQIGRIVKKGAQTCNSMDSLLKVMQAQMKRCDTLSHSVLEVKRSFTKQVDTLQGKVDDLQARLLAVCCRLDALPPGADAQHMRFLQVIGSIREARDLVVIVNELKSKLERAASAAERQPAATARAVEASRAWLQGRLEEEMRSRLAEAAPASGSAHASGASPTTATDAATAGAATTVPAAGAAGPSGAAQAAGPQPTLAPSGRAEAPGGGDVSGSGAGGAGDADMAALLWELQFACEALRQRMELSESDSAAALADHAARLAALERHALRSHAREARAGEGTAPASGR